MRPIPLYRFDRAAQIISPVAEREPWMVDAACVGHHALFERDEDERSVRAAKAICQTCPVLQQCFAFAERTEGTTSWRDLACVLAGETPLERVRRRWRTDAAQRRTQQLEAS